MGDILWLDTGDRGTGMQIKYNYVILSWALFLEIFFDYFMHRPFAPSWRVSLLSSRVTAAV